MSVNEGQETPPSATQQETAQDESDQQGKTALDRLADAMKRPLSGAAVAGGVVVGAVVIFGLAEAAVGAGAAYIAYRMIKKRQQTNRP
jgi:hypothetical protein